jgi:hypothetical protein
VGISWAAGAPAAARVAIETFYVARPAVDTAATLNAALSQGKNLLFTPGIYHVDAPIQVTRAGTIVMGLGVTTLVPDRGTTAMTVADVDGVQIAGLMFDAGATESQTLLELGPGLGTSDHSKDPTFLYDVYCRVGGATVGTAASCLTINSNDVVADNLWLWRADHGAGANWTVNKSKNGLVVNGTRVTVYGLFAEHFQEYQTLWNGNSGRVLFYQSEMPYDPPDQPSWQHAGVNGFASYKVADTVTTHDAWGLGVYSVFRNPVVADNAFETSTAPGVTMHHLITVSIMGPAGSSIAHIINGTGNAVPQSGGQARTSY